MGQERHGATDQTLAADTILLDSSAVVAVLFDEDGADEVVRLLPVGAISAVNLSEAVSLAVREGADFDRATELVLKLSLAVVAFTPRHALEAASLQRFAKEYNLSLSDRCCLATAVSLGVPVLTGDRRWAELDIGADVRLFR